MDDKHLVAVIDFGSQYTQLIVRRVRELGYMAKLYALEDLDQIHEPGAVILSGGPKSTTDADAPDIDFEWLKSLNVPVLGVCYGMQLLNIKHGGSVKASNKREYGPAALLPEACTGLYQDMSPSSQVWMSHSDTVDHLAEGCRVIARNAEGVPVSLQWGEATFGIQFHPEVTHSHEGRTILRNFLSCAANLKKFDIGDFKRQLIREIRERVGSKQVVCGVSGGVDSTVLAVLLHEAGVNMRAIFVDNGLLRKNEADEVRANFARMNVEIETVDASERFLTALAGEGDPEKKRRIIGGLFIDVFWDAVGDAEMLAQGTLYPDVIESASNAKSKAIPHDILWRHPFPGPGLAVRCPGVVTRDRLDIIRECDAIFIGNLKKYGWYEKVWQAYAGLIPVKTVGVKGDERSYEWATNLRAIVSEDAMTADWVELPPALLRETSNRILNEVKGINRVLYDISTKPPASIEWE